MPAKRRSPGDGCLYKRKDGLWVGSVTISSEGGKQRRKTVSSRDRGEAMRKLRELQLAIAEGVIGTSTNMTVGAWLDYWLEHIRGPKVRPNTRTFYEESIRLHIKPAIGGKRLGQLTAVQVREMLESIDSTRNRQRAHMVLRLALKSAMAERILRYNITDAVPKPDHVAKQIDAFDVATAQHVIATGLGLDEVMGVRWAAAFLTGARQGELLGLRWQHVDLKNGCIELAWQLQEIPQKHGCGEPDAEGNPPCGKVRPGYCPQRKFDVPASFTLIPLDGALALTPVKSKAGNRVVPLVPPLWAAFIRLREIAPVNEFDLVWATPDGKPIYWRADHRAWKKLLSDASVPDAPLHAARHTATTLLHAAGVDRETRMKITGHSSAAAHQGYIHVSLDSARAAVEKGLAELMPKELD